MNKAEKERISDETETVRTLTCGCCQKTISTDAKNYEAYFFDNGWRAFSPVYHKNPVRCPDCMTK